MALHDVEGNIQAVDNSFQQFGLGTNSVSPVREGQTVGKIVTKSNQIISTDSTGVDRVLLGFQEDGFGTGKDQGIKVSQDGYDVLTATNSQLIMSSAFNMFKIIATGSGRISAGAAGSSTYVDITHNLGVKPVVLLFGYPPDTSQWWGAGYSQMMPIVYWGLTGGLYAVDAMMFAQITTTTMRIAVSRSAASAAGAAGEWTYQFYMMQETQV